MVGTCLVLIIWNAVSAVSVLWCTANSFWKEDSVLGFVARVESTREERAKRWRF